MKIFRRLLPAPPSTPKSEELEQSLARSEESRRRLEELLDRRRTEIAGALDLVLPPHRRPTR